MSGAADSLYSQDDLFFTVQADVVGAGGGCSCAQLLCPLRRLLGTRVEKQMLGGGLRALDR